MDKNKKILDVAVCPLCGESDKIFSTNKKSYDTLLEKNGDACVTIECWRCGVMVIGYSMECENKAYEFVARLAAHKWNRLSDKIWKVADND